MDWGFAAGDDLDPPTDGLRADDGTRIINADELLVESEAVVAVAVGEADAAIDDVSSRAANIHREPVCSVTAAVLIALEFRTEPCTPASVAPASPRRCPGR